MAKNKYYAVAVGRNPGIYETWPEAEEQVKGFPSAKYKGFSDRQDAENYYTMMTGGEVVIDSTSVPEPIPKVYAGRHVKIFVDGSYNSDTNDYGYGVYVEDDKEPKIFVGKGQCVGGGRNIEGEIEAATVALAYALRSQKYDSVTIYHDLEHIGAVGDHKWTPGTPYTQEYQRFVDSVRRSGLAVDFEHVNGHTGVTGNEYVDKLAKMGCGVPLKPKERTFISVLKGVEGFPVDCFYGDRELPDTPKDNSDVRDLVKED